MVAPRVLEEDFAMILRALSLFVIAPIVAVAIVAIGAGLALQMALGPVFGAVSRCTQWRP